MSTNEEIYDLVERYLERSLSVAEHKDFEKKLASDTELQLYVEKVRKVNELVFKEGLSNQLLIIKKAEAEYMFRQKLINYSKWIGGSLFIALLALVVINYSNSDGEKIGVAFENKTLIDTLKSSSENSGVLSSTIAIKKGDSLTLIIPEDGSNTLIEKEKGVDKANGLVSDALPTVKQKVAIDENNKKTEAISKEDLCKETIVGTFDLQGSCASKNEGVISVKSISGGNKPYSLSLNTSPFKEVDAYNFLSAGNYLLSIKDSKGCKSENYQLVVEEKECATKKIDIVYSYQNSSEWIFPELLEDNFQFNVYTTSGVIIYSSTSVNNYPSSWNVIGSDGQRLSIGLYTFRFLNAGNILMQGTITIAD